MAVQLWDAQIESETRSDGTIIVRRKDRLDPYPDRLSDKFEHWAKVDPERIWMAERDGEAWREMRYGAALALIRALGQAILEHDLSPERPLMILSGNSINHALMALAAQYVGVPSAAISPAYSLISKDFGKLRDIDGQLTPGMVFAEDCAPFAPAIEAVIAQGVPIVCCANAIHGREVLDFNTLCGTAVSDDVDNAKEKVGPDTVAKFLFTSGTTGSPKAVIQTQRMLCSNMQMSLDCYAFMREEPPVVVDWAPWNHTASGNKVFNLVIYNGGTFYLDQGNPSPAGMVTTLKNLREISPTWYFNVPAGYDVLINAMGEDAVLRETFFKRLKMMMYAGAGMAQHAWDKLKSMAVETTGQDIHLATGLGATETGPFALFCTDPQDRPGNIGIPAQDCEIKLVPDGGKLEARVKGPHVTPGYWRNAKLTAEAFDEEGFYRLGDAIRFAVPGDASKGFFFDGRIAENFKLHTGTWVAVGAVRAKLVDALGSIARDVVLAGEDKGELRAILLPFMPALRALVPDTDLDDVAIMRHPAVRTELAKRLGEHAKQATGSSARVVAAMWMETPPSLDKGEVTDKGSINQRAVLRHRGDLIEALYDDNDARVVRANKG